MKGFSEIQQHRSGCPVVQPRPWTWPSQAPSRSQRQTSHTRQVVTAASPQAEPQLQERLQQAGGGVMSDKTVPQEHQGLHGFLYGEGGAEAHDADDSYRLQQVIMLGFAVPRSHVHASMANLDFRF